MPSYFTMMIEKIRQLRLEADTAQNELNDGIQELISAGYAASVTDEDPDKAIAKYLQKLNNGNVISGADVKANVPSTRELSHRAITARLTFSPLMARLDEKDQFGLLQFRRIDPNAAITSTAAE
jgi:hypothetical protein